MINDSDLTDEQLETREKMLYQQREQAYAAYEVLDRSLQMCRMERGVRTERKRLNNADGR